MTDNTTGFLGFDPGVTGAVGVIYPDGRAMVLDPPVIALPVGGKKRSQILETSAAKMILDITGLSVQDPLRITWRAGIEWAQATPILRPKKGLTPCSECGRSIDPNRVPCSKCGSVGDDPDALARQGSVSAFSYGQGFGVWLGVLATLAIPTEKFRPQYWKAAMLAGFADKGKDAARLKAATLFPGLELGRRKDQGRAEAILICELTRRIFMGGVDARAV